MLTTEEDPFFDRDYQEALKRAKEVFQEKGKGTNRPEMLDQALLRPGRFDRQITIPTPDVRGREAILAIHAKDKKLAENVTLKGIAEDTAGFTGAELANILNEAAITATRNKHKVIEQEAELKDIADRVETQIIANAISAVKEILI